MCASNYSMNGKKEVPSITDCMWLRGGCLHPLSSVCEFAFDDNNAEENV